MSDNSKIEWTNSTWNCVTGCTKVSPGCDNCYAETFAERWRGTSGHHFEQGFDVRLWPERVDLPMRWRKPKKIFVNSMSDVFHERVPSNFIGSMWNTMALTPRHTYQVLTKRHGRMRSLLSKWEAAGWYWRRSDMLWCGPLDGPLPNVHLGVSAENEHWFDIRASALLETPAAVRFISAEPLLGPIRMRATLLVGAANEPKTGINWVIVGGESGPGARPMDIGWVRDIIAQCRDAGVAVFVKQLGSVWAHANGGHSKGGDWDLWPEDLRIREFPAAVGVPA